MTAPRRLSTPVAFGLAALACATDQAIKALVVSTMALGERIAFLPFLDWLHARNFGVAFSFLGNAPGGAISLLTAAITLFVAVLLVRTPREEVLNRLAFALIIGGALGNLIDRIRLGYVVDYVYFHTPMFDFAIFNLADTVITIGAALLILSEFLPRAKRQSGEDSPS